MLWKSFLQMLKVYQLHALVYKTIKLPLDLRVLIEDKSVLKMTTGTKKNFQVATHQYHSTYNFQPNTPQNC